MNQPLLISPGTSEKGFDNPWGNMDVNDIPIEIVSDLNDTDDVKSVALE